MRHGLVLAVATEQRLTHSHAGWTRGGRLAVGEPKQERKQEEKIKKQKKKKRKEKKKEKANQNQAGASSLFRLALVTSTPGQQQRGSAMQCSWRDASRLTLTMRSNTLPHDQTATVRSLSLSARPAPLTRPPAVCLCLPRSAVLPLPPSLSAPMSDPIAPAICVAAAATAAETSAEAAAAPPSAPAPATAQPVHPSDSRCDAIMTPPDEVAAATSVAADNDKAATMLPVPAAAAAATSASAVASAAAAAAEQRAEQPAALPAAASAASRSLEVTVPSDAAAVPSLSLAQLLTIKQQWESFGGAACASASASADGPASAAPLSSVGDSLALLWSHRASMTMQLLRDSGIGRALTAIKKKGRPNRQTDSRRRFFLHCPALAVDTALAEQRRSALNSLMSPCSCVHVRACVYVCSCGRGECAGCGSAVVVEGQQRRGSRIAVCSLAQPVGGKRHAIHSFHAARTASHTRLLCSRPVRRHCAAAVGTLHADPRCDSDAREKQ